jgi:hypothetical protein
MAVRYTIPPLPPNIRSAEIDHARHDEIMAWCRENLAVRTWFWDHTRGRILFFTTESWSLYAMVWR